MSTRSSTDSYIVVLDAAADAVRALLFDSEARRMEGYAAQLPRHTAAAEADCLDEMHRLVQADGFRIAAVVGRAESALTAEDRSSWPAFAGAAWFPALPEGAGMAIGSGCVCREKVALAISGSGGMVGMVVDRSPGELPAGLTCTAIDHERWLLAGAVPEAGGAYAAVKRELNLKGSIEGYLETASADDPHLARLDSVGRRFLELLSRLERRLQPKLAVLQVVGLLKSPGWAQRITNILGVPITLCTEPEAASRGAALWALHRIGAIESLDALPVSLAAVFTPLETKT